MLIQQVQFNGETRDVLISGNRIEKIAEAIEAPGAEIVDGRGKAILPTFHNVHTHSAMSLMRGYADDIELHTWLTDYIWPLEANLTEEDVYHGTKLACLEMIKTGTTFFNDMYWHFHGSARAAEEMGLRAAISGVFIDFGNPEKVEENKQSNQRLFEESKQYSDRIQFALGPHAIYTVCREDLQWAAGFARANDLRIHIHLSETEKEVNDCVAEHGMRPVEYLDSFGFLGLDVIAAHSIWLSENEMDILAARGVKVVHNPCSNMKLASGVFNLPELLKRGVHVSLGTDGDCSNNNLDMSEEMKFAALLAKSRSGNPLACPAQTAFDIATVRGAEAFGLESGRIEEGALADCMLVNLNHYKLTPGYHLISDMVYSADPSCIDTVICDGRILMQNGKVEGEEEIIRQAVKTRDRLIASVTH
jgi:5-methylthioadenosine/S-adenosylhomocysteine deaminase